MQETESKHSLRGLHPVCLNDLLRLGRGSDGGYVVNERAIRQSRYLLSFGVNDDWSFEADFHKLMPQARILCFDYSVSRDIFRERVKEAANRILSARFFLGALTLNFAGVRNKFRALRNSIDLYSGFSRFFSNDNIRFYAAGISNVNSSHFMTMSDVFRLLPESALPDNSVFVKMDIEQGEFRVLPDLLQFARYVCGLAIEFHDLDVLWPNFIDLMNSFRNHFDISHIHGNNYFELIPGSRTPRALEVTLLKRCLIRDGERPREAVTYPIDGLDKPNDETKKDYTLAF